MTQIASVLAVATVFIGLWTLISTFNSERVGTYTCDKNTYAVTWAKSVGAYAWEGQGVIVGFYSIHNLW